MLMLFKDGIIPQDYKERNEALRDIPETVLNNLDQKAYGDIASDCYQYLQ